MIKLSGKRKKAIKRAYNAGEGDEAIAQSLKISPKDVFSARKQLDLLSSEERNDLSQKKRRRTVAGLIATSLVLGVATVSAGYTVWRDYIGTTLEHASRDQDPKLRQNYLNKVFEQCKPTAGESWESIDRLVYDPQLKRLYSRFKDRKIESGSADYAKAIQTVTMATPYFGNDGEKSRVYVTEGLFTIAQTDDEVCSDIDDESVHAMIIEKGKAHVDLPEIDVSDAYDPFVRAAIEVLSFELRFNNIMTGKRKVRQKFVNGLTGPARAAYKSIGDIADATITPSDPLYKKFGHVIDGAKSLQEMLEQRGTLKYFK